MSGGGGGVQAVRAEEGWADAASQGRHGSNRRIFPCGLWALQTHGESVSGSGWGCFLLGSLSGPGEE